jgi:hypothetical protein
VKIHFGDVEMKVEPDSGADVNLMDEFPIALAGFANNMVPVLVSGQQVQLLVSC